MLCSSCKKNGHFSHECDLDPNNINGLQNIKLKAKVQQLNLDIQKKFNRNSKELRSNKSFADIHEIREIASQSVSPEQSFSLEYSHGNISTRSNGSFRTFTPTKKNTIKLGNFK